MERRLAAILAADVEGYSRLMGADEVGTLRNLTLRRAILDGLIASHRGRIANTGGDSVLAEFGSAVDAVQCAVEAQAALAEANAGLSPDRHMNFRIGIHVGDVMVKRGDLFGDGVNIAARLQTLASAGGTCISSVAHDQVRKILPFAFTDLGAQQVKNIEEPIRAFVVSAKAGSAVGGYSTASVPLALPDKPSIAVLPFQNMSGDPEQEYFCDGLVEDIITTISKLAGLRVIARNSSFVYKGRSVDIREAAKQLGVRYILEGSTRRSGNRIRVTAQLIDAQDGAHLWAERYDRALDDIFAIQDEITLVLATEMQVKLTEGEQARLHYTTTSNIDAWTYWVKGLAHFRQAITKEHLTRALADWQKALALDPASAALNGMLGLLHYIDARFDWWDDRQTAHGKARAYADRALELDPENPDANTASSHVMLLDGRYIDAAFYARKATQTAPGSADTATLACFVLAFAGYPNEAVVHGEMAMTLSPHYPATYLGILGNAYRLAGRVEEAINAFKAYNARNPGFGLVDMVIVYQQTNQPEEAKATAEQLLSIRKDFTTAGWANTQFFRADKAQLEVDIAALNAAGLPVN